MPTPHNVDNYAIGKGILYLAAWNGDTPPAAEAYTEIGNCPSVQITPSTDRKEHYTSRADLKTKDKNPVIEVSYKLEFTCDEIAAVNLSKFLLGSVSGNVIHGLQSANAEYALKFVSDNPIGPNQTWEFWKATVEPNGALSLIGDDWIEMSYMADGLSDVANNPTSPYFDVTFATTTTTTSTTTTTTT